MAPGPADFDSFLRLGESLRELEVTVGPNARPVIAEVRAKLAEAAASRGKGDMAAAIDSIRTAMARLAALAGELDPGEGYMMRMIADRFSQALNFGDKGTAKETVNFMRHKAGDPNDDPDTEW
jgi:hypothetical protein